MRRRTRQNSPSRVLRSAAFTVCFSQRALSDLATPRCRHIGNNMSSINICTFTGISHKRSVYAGKGLTLTRVFFSVNSRLEHHCCRLHGAASPTHQSFGLPSDMFRWLLGKVSSSTVQLSFIRCIHRKFYRPDAQQNTAANMKLRAWRKTNWHSYDTMLKLNGLLKKKKKISREDISLL